VRLTTSKTGYKTYCGSYGSRSKRKLFRIHRCVAEAFIPKLEGKDVVNHIDGNKINNSVDNLEWCTDKENTRHAWENGLCKIKTGTAHHSSKLSKEDIIYIKENYIPRDKCFGARALGRKFKVNHKAIGNVVRNKAYYND